MKKLLLLFALTLSLYSCEAQQKKGIELVPPAQFETEITADKGQVIDVRTPKEYAAGHIADAVNIHLYDKDFGERIEKLDKKKTVLCTARLAEGAQKL
jgi:phage shock protein E